MGLCVQKKRTRGQVEWHEHSQGVQPEPLYIPQLAGSPNLSNHPNCQKKEEGEGTMTNVDEFVDYEGLIASLCDSGLLIQGNAHMEVG